jgi:hypothetical protein
MSKRLFGGFVLVVAVLLALGTSATAQRKTAVAADGVLPLNFTGNSLSTHTLFLDLAANRVCGLLTVSPIAVHCEPLPITIPPGAPVVALNQTDGGLHYFVVGTGLGATQVCAVTSSPTVGTTVCSASPF